MSQKLDKRGLFISLALIIFASVNMVLGAEISKNISTKALWENKKEVKLEQVLTIGTDDFEEDERYFFALIVDIQFDKNGNLFVLDSKNRRLNKYSPKGIFLQFLELRKGKGPGDYLRPQSVAIDKEDKIYIADRFKRVTILDKNGKLLKLFNISEKGMPANIAVGPANSLYLTKFNNLNIHRIFQYSSLNGQLMKNFCKSSNAKLVRENGESIALDSDSNIYYTASYPYERNLDRCITFLLFCTKCGSFESILPEDFSPGFFINLGYCVVLFFLSYYFFTRQIFRMPGKEYPAEGIDIE